jgi:hypothetical protein
MSADITSLSDFLSTWEEMSPVEAAAELQIGDEMFTEGEVVYIYDSLSYISHIPNPPQGAAGPWHVLIGNHDSLHATQDEAATRLYLEHYVSECVQPTAWSTAALTSLLIDFSKFYGLEYASADEMLFLALHKDPQDRTYRDAEIIAWLEWFIDLWNEVQMSEDVAAVMDY